MRLRFIGGPWDGVEFDSTYSPQAISFRDMDQGATVPSSGPNGAPRAM
jgi:hypothetical protein